MKSYWDQLRPMEKRLVVGVGTVIFIVLNLWFVVPHFSDWGNVKRKMANAQFKLQQYEQELSHTNALYREVRELESEEGTTVPAEEQAVHFASTIQSQLIQVGLVPKSVSPPRSSTNQNFIEVSEVIALDAKEQPLVDFLFNLGRGTSLIRARDMRLNPDPPHQLLQATITLVGNYQAKPPARGSAAPVQTQPARTTPTTTSKTAPPTTGPMPNKGTAPAPHPGTTTPPNLKGAPPAGRAPTNLVRPVNPLQRPGMTNKPANTKKS